MQNHLFSRRPGRWSVLAGAVIVFAVISFALINRTVRAAETAPPIPLEKTAVLAQMEDGFAAIAQKLEPSVVMIRVQKTVRAVQNMPEMPDFFRNMPGMEDMPGAGRGAPRSFMQKGAGSGVVVRSDGWILTNDHVAGGADKVTVVLQDGRELEGTVRRDFRSDIALVKVNATGLVSAELGDSERVKVGQWAIAFGSPYELSNTMTLGVISAMHRQTPISDGSEGRFYPNLLQTDAAINPGNSGGPLVDIHGRIIGINVAINSPNGGSVGIGFAIPSNTAKGVMDQLINKGKVTRGYLGVAPKALTPMMRERYGVKAGGALVEQVSDNTPAAKAGIQVEDVILKIGGKAVTDDVSLRDIVSGLAPASKVDILLKRGGKDQTVTVTLGAMPDELAAASVKEEAGSALGVKVTTVNADNAKKYNLDTTATGVVVTEIQTGGAAEDAGIQPGDLILRVNVKRIQSVSDFQSATKDLKSGDTVTIVIRRATARVLVTLQIP